MVNVLRKGPAQPAFFTLAYDIYQFVFDRCATTNNY